MPCPAGPVLLRQVQGLDQMRTPPSQPYSGLTIVIDKPSRFDTERLLTGQPEQWLSEVLSPITLAACDVRDVSCNEPFLPGTTKVALLGAKAAEKYSQNPSLHGYPAHARGIPAVVGHYPQDCCDHRGIESSEDEDEEMTSDRETKDYAPTKRANFRFWTEWHLKKFLFSCSPRLKDIQPKFFPHAKDIISTLHNIRNEDLYLDIETSRLHRCLTCIGFSSTSLWPRVYCVPVYLSTGALAYQDFSGVYKAFASAFLSQGNTVVAHNASFDLLVLHAFYKFPLPSATYDTLLANHRAFPEIEKSLGHAIAQWTWQPYHKDTNTEALNSRQEQQLWLYNCKDVYTLKLIKDAQTAYAQGITGLNASIAQANSMICPYLRNSVTGMNIDRASVLEAATMLRKHTALYAKVCEILVGNKFNPGSPKQCKEYFHDLLHYPVVERSSVGAPKLGRKQLYQLLVKYDNPLINAILFYRKTAKALSNLESELWTTT